jgi:hypothetical protein
MRWRMIMIVEKGKPPAPWKWNENELPTADTA